MAFTAKDVQALREKTGCGMMDCKKALTEADGNMDKAVEVLREKGLATAAKKSGRIAAEGVVTTYVDAANNIGAIVEVNCETDFVAKNPDFIALANKVAKTVVEKKPADVDALNAEIIADGNVTVADAVQELFLSVRENMKIRRFELVEGVVSTYIHAGGATGVMVAFDTDLAANDGFAVYGKDIAMQIAAANPSYLNEGAVPAEVVEKEKEILLAQIANDPKMASKPEQVIAKMVEGKIKKYYKENCLVNQEFIKDGDLAIAAYTEKTAKELGGKIEIKGFVRFERGEGIEKKSDDFANEVASMVK